MFPVNYFFYEVMIIIMEISTAPFLLKLLQPKVHTKATHTHTHTSSFKNYMPPKYTYQKAENQTIGASFAFSPSLSLSMHRRWAFFSPWHPNWIQRCHFYASHTNTPKSSYIQGLFHVSTMPTEQYEDMVHQYATIQRRHQTAASFWT